DQTFGYNKKHLKEIISILSKFNFKFIIYTRADTLNLKELRLLKKAGLECVETGIENADYKIRKKFGKNISDKTIIDFFRNCNKLHIKTLAIFIAGLGLDNKLSIRKTLFLLKEIKPDYISVNSFIRKTGTSFETENPYNENQDPSKHNHKTSEFKRKIYIAHYFSIRIISKELYNAFKNKKIKNLFKNFAGFIKNII
ncbi:MAG: radical SAM protein, partial [Candidatus Muiribacteriota bacterium]